MKFVKNEDAVSPVIGVILMVAITVILAAVIAAFVFNLGGSQEKAPTASIVAANAPDTTTVDLKISHKGGDMLKGGDYKLSVVPVGSATNFQLSVSGSDLAVGAQISVSNTSVGCPTNCTLTNSSFVVLAGTYPMTAASKYDVKLVHVPSSAMMIDTVVEVR